jgi:hypothetical protein
MVGKMCRLIVEICLWLGVRGYLLQLGLAKVGLTRAIEAQHSSSPNVWSSLTFVRVGENVNGDEGSGNSPNDHDMVGICVRGKKG